MHGKFMPFNCIHKVTNDQLAKAKESYNSEIKLKNMVLDKIIEKNVDSEKINRERFQAERFEILNTENFKGNCNPSYQHKVLETN